MREDYWEYYKCPSCFFRWCKEFQGRIPLDVGQIKARECDFCRSKEMTEVERLRRMGDVLEETSMADFPQIMRLLLEHVVLKE